MKFPASILIVALGLLGLAGCGRSPSNPTDLLQGTHVTFRGHAELARDEAGAWQPFFPSAERPVRLCLDAPVDRDTTRWKLAIGLEQHPERLGSAKGPSEQLGNTLCFSYTPPTEQGDGWTQLCAVLVDEYDGRSTPIPCRPLRLSSRDPRYIDYIEGFNWLMSQIRGLSTEELLERLDSRERYAREAGFPFLAMRCALVATHFARRSGDVPVSQLISELRDSRPDWLDGEHGEEWAAQFAYETAVLLAEDPNRRAEAWSELRLAEDMYRRIADPRSLTVTMRQAEILAQVGAVGEGIVRLETALERCEQVDCLPVLRGAARNTLVWMALQDPDAPSDLLSRVEVIQREAVAELTVAGEPIELANAEINLAFARAKLGSDPIPSLRRARGLLESVTGQEALRAKLGFWSNAVEAYVELQQADPSVAESMCRELFERAYTPPMLAWAHTCLSRALRAAGRLPQARDSIQRARVLHAFGAGELEEGMALGSDQRAEAAFLAAMLALDDSDPGAAWAILEQTDQRSMTAGDCPLPTAPEVQRAWNALLLQLLKLDGPASSQLRNARREERRELMRRAEELLRNRQSCAPRSTAHPVAAVDYRAFTLDGEIALLRRHGDGGVETYRRTRMAPSRLHALLETIQRSEIGDDDTWTTTIRPLADALVPRVEDLDETTVVAAHGTLQRIPWGALPLTGPHTGYLGQRTALIQTPAGASWSRAFGQPPPRRPLFVVDPAENMTGGAGLVEQYRRLFPQAEVLYGAAATSMALRQRLGRSDWLHIDAHGVFEPSFPELSAVILADGKIPAAAWAADARPMQLANLSTCGGGRWPVTADSGRFGLAGWLARRGTRWVISSRSDLPNDLALDFNQAFYTAIREGEPVDRAFARAIRNVSQTHPAQDWGALILLRGADPQENPAKPA